MPTRMMSPTSAPYRPNRTVTYVAIALLSRSQPPFLMVPGRVLEGRLQGEAQPRTHQ